MSSPTLLEKFQTNLILFGKTIAPNTFSVKSPKMHYEMAAELQDPSIPRLNIVAPRGFSKTSIVGLIYVLWHCFVQKLPEGKFPVVVLVSKTRPHTIKMLQSIKDVLNYSMPFRNLFGYHGEQNAVKWAEDEIILDNGIMIIAKGMGTQVVGLKYLNQRPTLIIADDPEEMEFNLRWLLQSLYPSRDPQVGKVVVIGTPQHQRCIVEMLSSMKRWKTLRYQAIINMGSEDEVSAWEEWRPVKEMLAEKEEMESIGRVDIFYREMQCLIVGGSAQLFKPAYIKYYDGYVTHNKSREGFLTLKARDGERYEDYVIPVSIYMGIDPASSTRSGADPSVVLPVAIDKDDNHYILPYYRARVTPMDFGAKVLEWYETYKPRNTSVEATGYQEMLRDYLRKQRFIPGLEVKYQPRDRKSVRLESLQPRFAQHKVFLMTHMTEMVDELLMYPRGKHDDILDAYWYALRRVHPPSHVIEKKVEISDHMKYYAGLKDLMYPWEKDEEEEEKE